MAGIILNNRNGDVVAVEAVVTNSGNYAFMNAPPDGLRATYSFGARAIAPVATPTDVVEIRGSASKTVRVRRILIGGVATAAGNMPVQLVRRSAASTGGGSTLNALSANYFDTSFAAVTATAGYFSVANPTLGAGVGGIGPVGTVCLSASGSGVGVSPFVFDFDLNAFVLRGSSQYLYINMAGAALPAGAAFDFTVILQEDVS